MTYAIYDKSDLALFDCSTEIMLLPMFLKSIYVVMLHSSISH